MERSIYEFGVAIGPPIEMVEEGYARVIPYDELPEDSWQREEMLAGRRLFTQWMYEKDAPKFELPLGQSAVSSEVDVAEESVAA